MPGFSGHMIISSGYLALSGISQGAIEYNGIRVNPNNFNRLNTAPSKPRFSKKVESTAWNLLKEYMTEDQHFAFMENSVIELQSDVDDYRLLISKSGNFTILKGGTGAGITMSTGKIASYDYPLGDEIATFINWLKSKPEQLISNWNCGTYGIVEADLRR